MGVVFLADWFADNFQRGAELNDSALINHLNISIDKVLCEEVKEIDEAKFYIVGNFTKLPNEIKNELIKKKNYLIYEHDHKYCVTRNPFSYIKIVGGKSDILPNPSGIVPSDNLINLDFYKAARVVICLTDWHQKQLNLNIDCKTTNIHGSMWSLEDLDFIDQIRETTRKVDKCGVFNDQEQVQMSNGKFYNQGKNIKNKQGNIKYCIDNDIKYRLIPRINDRTKFLKVLASHTALSFFPDIPETCSRLLTEARMLGLEVYTNNNSGAYHEDWFKLQGKDLTDHYRNTIIPNAINLFKGYINEYNSNSLS